MVALSQISSLISHVELHPGEQTKSKNNGRNSEVHGINKELKKTPQESHQRVGFLERQINFKTFILMRKKKEKEKQTY